MIDDIPVGLSRNRIELHALGFIDGIEQRRERMAKIEAAAAAVTDIEDPLQLLKKRPFVIERL